MTPNGILKVCAATHPNMPNHSGNARGRKVHLLLEGNKTLCNMKKDGATYKSNSNCLFDNGFCRQCVSVAARKNLTPPDWAFEAKTLSAGRMVPIITREDFNP
jgi:hypothetical protein